MVIYSHLFLFSRWEGSWQQGSTFMHHRVRMSCLWSTIVMVSVLATSQGLCEHCSWRWVIVSPHFSLTSRSCFVGIRTFGMCVWSSTRDLRPITFAASTMWSRLPHQGGRLREAWERLHEKLWCCCDMKRRNKWSIRSTATFWAMPEKELKL
jgi:hypothetical protein